jgi:hypothetical protein
MGEALADARHKMQRSMLVEVMKCVEVSEYGPVLSTVRLHVFDQLPRLWMHGSNPAVHLPLGRSAFVEDRKLGTPFLPLAEFSGVGDSKIKGEMVKCGAEVEQTISDERTPFDLGRGLVDLDPPKALACFDVVVTANGVSTRVNEPLDFALEGFAMNVCSAELLADPATY